MLLFDSSLKVHNSEHDSHSDIKGVQHNTLRDPHLAGAQLDGRHRFNLTSNVELL